MGRALALEYVKYGYLGGSWVVPGSTPSQDHPRPHHPGYTSPPTAVRHRYTECSPQLVPRTNSAVGLKSVEQLSLCPLFSDLRTMTEVYNLVRIGNR